MIQFRRRKSDGQAFPIGRPKPRLPKSDNNKSNGMKIGSGTRIPKSSQTNVLDEAVKKLEKDIAKGLKEYDFKINPSLKNQEWDVNIIYTGSHGTVDSEYFTATVSPKGRSLSYQADQAFSNDDWSQGTDDDSGYMKKLDEDSDFAEKEYNKWLAETLELYNDALFEELIDTIENKFRGDE